VTVPVHFYPISCKPQLPVGPWTQLEHPAAHMIAADVDGDGHVDAIVAEPSYEVAVYRGHGDGTFDPPTSIPISTQVNALAIGDFNGDGHVDLVIAARGASSLLVAVGIGNGSFAAPTTISLPSEPYALSVGDFDRNGKLDLAVSLPNLNEILIETGAGNGT